MLYIKGCRVGCLPTLSNVHTCNRRLIMLAIKTKSLSEELVELVDYVRVFIDAKANEILKIDIDSIPKDVIPTVNQAIFKYVSRNGFISTRRNIVILDPPSAFDASALTSKFIVGKTEFDGGYSETIKLMADVYNKCWLSSSNFDEYYNLVHHILSSLEKQIIEIIGKPIVSVKVHTINQHAD